MAIPITRNDFKEYCLRKLGKPVIEINVSDDQVEDRIDQALAYYRDYHFDGSEKVYYKHQITGQEFPGAANDVIINDGGTGYSNTDTVSFTGGNAPQATATVNTYSNGTIQSINLSTYGSGYSNNSAVTITSNTGSGASASLVIGDGSIGVEEKLVGVIRVFPIGDPSMGSDDLFNIRYQIALNELYNLTSVSLTPYYTARMHLSLIEELLIGKQPIRFNRHKDRIHVDFDWEKMNKGEYLLFEAYKYLDPDEYTDVWGDRWLQNYTTALIKYQWGSNLTKFSGMQLPGGVQFNGERILVDAQNEITKLEEEMIMSYSLPVMDMIN